LGRRHASGNGREPNPPTTMVSKKTGLNPVRKRQYVFSTYPHVGTTQKIVFTL
jgi:hypothetical protein